MIEALCPNREEHEPHGIPTTFEYPCMGPQQCGQILRGHVPHMLGLQFNLHCSGKKK